MNKNEEEEEEEEESKQIIHETRLWGNERLNDDGREVEFDSFDVVDVEEDGRDVVVVVRVAVVVVVEWSIWWICSLGWGESVTLNGESIDGRERFEKGVGGQDIDNGLSDGDESWDE